MASRSKTLSVVPLLLLACQVIPAAGQETRALMVNAGRPLRLLLDTRTRVSRVGQPIEATVAESVYVYDRVVIPEGTKASGHIAKLEGPPAAARVATMLGGDFTPSRSVGLVFDALVLANGARVPIVTIVTPGAAPSTKEVAGDHDDGIVGHARQQAAQQAREAVAAIRGPGKLARLGHFLVGRLPVHPQYLDAGAALSAQLVEPVQLGIAEPVDLAPNGARPPPESILSARLVTALDSSSTRRGTPIRAILTRPLMSEANAVILPEGTAVSGTVTFVKAAGKLRHNGQIRFLFESMEVPGRSPEPLTAALYSADVGRDQHLVIDEEGGATITNPVSRFIAPALAGAALVVPLNRTEISDEAVGGLTTEASVVGHGARGFSGFGLLGVGLALVSRPAAVALGAFGFGRALYLNILGNGHDVTFPANTPMQIQLAPSPQAESEP